MEGRIVNVYISDNADVVIVFTTPSSKRSKVCDDCKEPCGQDYKFKKTNEVK